MTLEFAEIDPASQQLLLQYCMRATSAEKKRSVGINSDALFHTNPNGGARI